MEEMKTLVIALARVIAVKPHSADVERLISRYNILKSPARSRLNTDTLHYYILVIGFNLPPLASYDARPAVRYCLTDKKRKPSASSKCKTQKRWFNGVFFENSIGNDDRDRHVRVVGGKQTRRTSLETVFWLAIDIIIKKG
ncbi:Hypothetical predicted protein [Paramuricea clavata]|uniref:Uncharacterized protein n=1 Tax=Paramuricea clavata TaxID=317549 RepID=A0A6S7G077_PARCT|nr:Hypothetical predicted protein [Paramuricea clavata]